MVVQHNLEKAILLACEQAMKSEMEYKHGAVVFDNFDIVSKGYNKRGTLAKLKSKGFNYSVHAEADALRKIKKIGTIDKLVVVRFKNNKLMNSKPCKSCMRLMRDRGVICVFYSDKNGNIEWELIQTWESMKNK